MLGPTVYFDFCGPGKASQLLGGGVCLLIYEMRSLKIITSLSQMLSRRLKEDVHVQNSTWCLVHNKCSIIAHCDIRNEGITKEEIINSTKEGVIEKVMPE